MFYGIKVILRQKNKNGYNVAKYDVDLSKEILLEEYITPFLNGEGISVDHSYFERNEILKIEIIETQYSLSEISKYWYTKYPGVIGFDKYCLFKNDLNDVVEDVTKKFIISDKLDPIERVNMENSLIDTLNGWDVYELETILNQFKIKPTYESSYGKYMCKCDIDCNATVRALTNEKLIKMTNYFKLNQVKTNINNGISKECRKFWQKAIELSKTDLPSAIVYQRKTFERFLCDILFVKEYETFSNLMNLLKTKFNTLKCLKPLLDSNILENYLHNSAHSFDIDFDSKVTINDFNTFFDILNELIDEINKKGNIKNMQDKYK